jgi:hypothetical protein
MRAARTKSDRLKQLYELYQSEWPYERYFKIGRLICRLLPLRAERSHLTHHTGKLLVLAKEAGLTPATAKRVPTQLYYCYQLARQLDGADLQLFKQHKILWSQIRLVLIALGRTGSEAQRKLMRNQIHNRLKSAGAARFTDFVRGLNPA